MGRRDRTPSPKAPYQRQRLLNLGAVWTLNQPTGVSQVTQVGIQTAPSGGTRLWLARAGANGEQYPLEYTDMLK